MLGHGLSFLLTLFLYLSHSHAHTPAHKEIGWKRGKPVRSPAVSCTETAGICTERVCVMFVCTFVCRCACSSVRCAHGCVHPDLCACLLPSLCVCVRVCVCADSLNWIMLWNTGCVGFRKSTACILLSQDINIMISVWPSNISCGCK